MLAGMGLRIIDESNACNVRSNFFQRGKVTASHLTGAALPTCDTLRRERQQSPRTQADAAHVAAKTEMLQLKLMEKKRELVRRADVDALIDDIAGVTLTALSSMPARCAPRGDLAIRRNIERVVFEVRTEMANVCQQMADKCGEPPPSEQG